MDKMNIVEIDINSKENIFNRFNKEQISDELATYILQNSKKSSANTKCKLVINQKITLTREEQNELVRAIRQYFGLLVKERLMYSKFNNTKQLWLLIIGILLIAFSNILTSIFDFLIPELFLIAGWVAIWEMVDSILFADNRNKMEIKIYKKLSVCEIEFK